MPSRMVSNVQELRKYLEEAESKWSERDKEVLGEFGLQGIWIPYFSENGEFEGYGTPYIEESPIFAVGCFVLDKLRDKGEQT